MNKFVSFLLLTVLAGTSTSAAAETDLLSRFSLYVGAGGSQVDVAAVDFFESDVKFKTGEITGGASWRWIGIEGRYGQSLVDETISFGTDPDTQVTSFSEVSIESYQSVYLRLQFENEFARIYGLYGQTSIETSSFVNQTTVVNASDSGTSYGLGAGIRVNDHVFFNLEVKSLIDTDTDSFTQSGFTIEFRFW